jgi:hypothetical protein
MVHFLATVALPEVCHRAVVTVALVYNSSELPQLCCLADIKSGINYFLTINGLILVKLPWCG